MNSSGQPPAPESPAARIPPALRECDPNQGAETGSLSDPPASIRRNRPFALWAFVAALLGVLGAMRIVGEAWPPLSLLFFLPRWIWLAPWAILGISARIQGRLRERSPLLAVSAAIILLFLMNVSLPFQRSYKSWSATSQESASPRVRIMTFNRWNRNVDSGPLIQLIDREGVDLVCFQEGTPDPKLDQELRGRGWSLDPRGRIVSRFPIVEVLPPPKLPDSYPDLWPTEITRVRLRHPSGAEFIAASVHVPSMRHAIYRLLDGDLDGLRRQIAWRREQIRLTADVLRGDSQSVPILAAGDFNTPADSPSLEPARRSFRFAFEEAGWGYGWTWPSQSPYLRLEHILGDPRWRFSSAWVGPDLGSDHRPLIADAVLKGSD